MNAIDVHHTYILTFIIYNHKVSRYPNITRNGFGCKKAVTIWPYNIIQLDEPLKSCGITSIKYIFDIFISDKYIRSYSITYSNNPVFTLLQLSV